MKLSFTTLGCPAWDFRQTIENAARMGYAGVEIRGIRDQMRMEAIPAFQPGNQRDTLRLLNGAGVQLCAFGTSIHLDRADGLAAALEEGRIAVDLCAGLGIPAIRVFGDQLQPDCTQQQTIDQVAAGLQALCAYAEGSPVDVLLEVHGQFNTIERLLPVCQAQQSRRFGLIWDVAHSDRAYGDDYLPFYLSLKPWIRHMHIKDHRRTPQGDQLCPVGEGDIPLPAILRTLQADGFDGWYSFEWEKRWHPELPEPEEVFPAYLRYMRGQEANL